MQDYSKMSTDELLKLYAQYEERYKNHRQDMSMDDVASLEWIGAELDDRKVPVAQG